VTGHRDDPEWWAIRKLIVGDGCVSDYFRLADKPEVMAEEATCG
jgi:hypothetical protein